MDFKDKEDGMSSQFFSLFYFLLLIGHPADSYSSYHNRATKAGHVNAQCPSHYSACLELHISFLWSLYDILWFLLFKCIFIYFFIYVEPRRWCWILCNWIYTWQWASKRVLGLKFRSSGRAVNSLNHQPTSPSLGFNLVSIL